MQFDDFLDSQWRIFLIHFCQYHPLDQAFIARYEYELNWDHLSLNPHLPWSLELLETYENRWDWQALSANPGITWDRNSIARFLDRLDWDEVKRNPRFKFTDELEDNTGRRILIYDDNVFLTPELRKKHDNIILTRRERPARDREMTLAQIDQLEETLTTFNWFCCQATLYEAYILPEMEKRGVEAIFEEKFDYSQRYFFLESIHTDQQGLTPEYEVELPKELEDLEAGTEATTFEPLAASAGRLQEGPDRLYEVPRLASSILKALLVSEGVKQVLEQLKLPAHRFVKVDLKPKKLKTTTGYYLFQLAERTLERDIDHAATPFFYQRFKPFLRWSLRYSAIRPFPEQVTGLEHLKSATFDLARELGTIPMNLRVFPETYRLTTSDDVHSFGRYNRVVVSEFVKDKLEAAFPGQMAFLSAQLLNIRMEEAAYNQGRERIEAMATDSIPRVIAVRTASELFYVEKMNRLIAGGEPMPPSSKAGDAYTDAEERLQVRFPASFKKRHEPGKMIGDFEWLSPGSFGEVSPAYYSRYPHAFKGVIVGDNGNGDLLGLLLKKNSDFDLRPELYEFNHETGEVYKYP